MQTFGVSGILLPKAEVTEENAERCRPGLEQNPGSHFQGPHVGPW